MANGITRRDFVAGTAMAGFGAMVVPRHVLGGVGHRAPSDTLNIAIVGAGGMGMNNAEQMLSENIVALCDVDFGYVERQLTPKLTDRDNNPRELGVKLKAAFDGAERFTDFRRMLERRRDIDAVVIATPDHSHAVIAEAAMRLGKHVYVQKPLAATVLECRRLAETARTTGVVTQMGNQGHSSDEARLINEWVQNGVIGPVREVNIWTNRPIWPQGVPRPAAPGTQPAPPTGNARWNSRLINEATAAALAGDARTIDGIDWELYLGPVPDVPYHTIYHPFNWRGWVDFGVGALGDMGAHLLDHPYWALDLGYPTAIEATSTPWGGPAANPASYPQAMIAHYEFPARGPLPPVRLHWYDGGLMPKRPDVLPDDVALVREGGVMYIGDRGILMHETYGRNPQLFPESLMETAQAVPQTMPRIVGGHEMNWVDACKGTATAVSPFHYAAPLTEVMLLGIVALRTGQGRKIHYDATAMRVTNADEANRFLTREYRPGWYI
jgi:predicted dehydrogenase